LLTAHADGAVRLWRLPPELPRLEWYRAGAASLRGGLVVVDEDDNLRVWTASGHQQHATTVPVGAELSLSPSGSLLAVADPSGRVRVVSTKSGRVAASIKRREAATPVFGPREDMLVLQGGMRAAVWHFRGPAWCRSLPIDAELSALSPDG